jgi:hypothetical protein
MNNIEYCTKVFVPYYLKGESVYYNEKKEEQNYVIYPDQTSMQFGIFCVNRLIPKGRNALNNETVYVDESDMEKLYIEVSMPDITGGTNRCVKVEMEFGGTEITVEATDLSSGNNASTTVNFIAI